MNTISKNIPITTIIAALGLFASACTDDTSTATETTATGTETGDGDGDMTGEETSTTDMTGDGDGDMTGDGDGDPATGDGDGDMTGDGDGDMTGDGDGDGDPEPFCGDGNVDDGEECDDGNMVDTDMCTNACVTAVCGDAIVQEGVEACDDGNDDNTDGCTDECAVETCGDGVVDMDMNEECDDGNDVNEDDCLNTCVAATCGDTYVQDMVEECDDGNDVNEDDCLDSCVAATCGDGFVQDMVEDCDDGNDDDTDDCVAMCVAATCGDGFVQDMVEECDDGNDVDDDLCSNDCVTNLVPLGEITLGGNSFSQITTALNTVAEPYSTNNTQWLPAGQPGDVLIMSNNGGNGNSPDYSAFLDSGGHILMIGGSSAGAYCTFIDGYFSRDGSCSWHRADNCADDWNKVGNHPMTAQVPDTYEFTDQNVSYHMTHFAEMGQPGGATLLGQTCHQAPDNYVLATRSYNNGGSFTYMALHLGPYNDPDFQAEFLVPFIQGYFDWLQMGAP